MNYDEHRTKLYARLRDFERASGSGSVQGANNAVTGIVRTMVAMMDLLVDRTRPDGSAFKAAAPIIHPAIDPHRDDRQHAAPPVPLPHPPVAHAVQADETIELVEQFGVDHTPSASPASAPVEDTAQPALETPVEAPPQALGEHPGEVAGEGDAPVDEHPKARKTKKLGTAL